MLTLYMLALLAILVTFAMASSYVETQAPWLASADVASILIIGGIFCFLMALLGTHKEERPPLRTLAIIMLAIGLWLRWLSSIVLN